MWTDETKQQNMQIFPPQPDLKELLKYNRGSQPAPPNRLLRVQLVLSAVMVLVVAVCRTAGLPLYPILEKEYRAVLARDMSLEKEKDWFSVAEKMLTDFEKKAEETAARLEEKFSYPAESSGEVTVQQAVWESFSVKQLPEGCSLKSVVPEEEWILPLEEYRISSPYGWRKDPITGQKGDFHKGIDLAAGEGTEIRAPMESWVEKVSADPYGGNWVLLRHGENFKTRYCHMQYIFVRVGDKVEKGQTIGTVGQTGRVTGPHLHWELFYENILYDPAEALGQAN